MARQRHLRNAPITEALVDIHVEPREGTSADTLRKAFSDLDFGYYLKGPISQGTFGFRFTNEGRQAETMADTKQVGLRLHSEDEKYVAQCRTNGFTLSRLPPYEDWSALIGEAQRVWSIYRERTNALRVTRIATRYINNLQLPMAHGESFQLYLQKFADVPDEAPQSLASFLQRFLLVDPPNSSAVNITIALESPPQDGRFPVILDIDAFTDRQLDPQSEQVWTTLECLRTLKNRCFFGSLTEKTVELYE